MKTYLELTLWPLEKSILHNIYIHTHPGKCSTAFKNIILIYNEHFKSLKMIISPAELK